MSGPSVISTSRSKAVLLLDTSVAVALAVEDHAHHRQVFQAMTGRTLGLAGHAAFETFSVLTRLPPPTRLAPASVHRLIQTNFPQSRFLGSEAAGRLLQSLAEHGIAGGSVYDALVGATALEHGLTLVTRDRRALATYRELGVSVWTLG